MENNKYNGWTNYATWRINLEIFDGYGAGSEDVDYKFCKDLAEEIVFGSVPENSLVAAYAQAFMYDVNWHEIAEHVNEE